MQWEIFIRKDAIIKWTPEQLMQLSKRFNDVSEMNDYIEQMEQSMRRMKQHERQEIEFIKRTYPCLTKRKDG